MAPPPGLSDAEYTGPFNTAFDQIRENVRDAIDSFNSLVGTVNHWSWALGLPVWYWIKRNLDGVREGLATLVEKVNYAIEHQMPVLSLITTSFAWVHTVKTPTSELSFAVTEPRNENLAKWTGDAAGSYNAKAGKQKAAVDEAVVKAEFISQWLFKIAKANVDFAVTLAKIVNDIAGKLAQAALDATTVIDIPWAIDKLSDSFGTIVKGGLDTLVSIGQRFIDALGNIRDLDTQVGDHSKLPGGAWPEAVRG
jgi:hypothetical protein